MQVSRSAVAICVNLKMNAKEKISRGQCALNTHQPQLTPGPPSMGEDRGFEHGNLEWQLAIISYQMYCAL